MKIEEAEKIAKSAIAASRQDIYKDREPFGRFRYNQWNVNEAALIEEVVSCLSLLSSIGLTDCRFDAVFKHSQTAFKKVKETKHWYISPEVSLVLLKKIGGFYPVLENNEIKKLLEDCAVVLIRSALILAEQKGNIFKMISTSLLANKTELIQIGIEYDKACYNEKGYSKKNLQVLTKNWEIINEFLSQDDIHWLKDCYVQPQSFAFQANGTWREFSNQLEESSPLVNIMTFYVMVCMMGFSAVLANKNHEYINGASLPLDEANKAHSHTDGVMTLLYTCFTLYLLSIPCRTGALLAESHRLFRATNPLPGPLPEWLDARLKKEEQADEELDSGATFVPIRK